MYVYIFVYYKKRNYGYRVFYKGRVREAGLRAESGGAPEPVEDYLPVVEERGDERVGYMWPDGM